MIIKSLKLYLCRKLEIHTLLFDLAVCSALAVATSMAKSQVESLVYAGPFINYDNRVSSWYISF